MVGMTGHTGRHRFLLGSLLFTALIFFLFFLFFFFLLRETVDTVDGEGMLLDGSMS